MINRIEVDVSKKYEVIIGKAIIADCGRYVREVVSPCKACIVCDDIVADLYLDVVRKSLIDSGFSTEEFVFKNGEASKNLDTYTNILEFMASKHITRSDIIIALGGGVAGDMAGFVAATYLRGIGFVQIPTTFLADIDSSVGGKTAVNLKSGKNLVGAFHQPSLVVCDTDCLKTLSKKIYLDGVAEAVKYAVLEDESLIDLLENDIEKAVKRCVEIKRDVVMGDEFEHGNRAFLNLGHTFGHSIEKLSNFEITHGHAVAVGMVLVSRGGERMGITESGTTDKIIEILENFGLPTDCKYSAKELSEIAMGDKKRSGEFITLVVPEKIGKCRLCKIPVSDLESFVN